MNKKIAEAFLSFRTQRMKSVELIDQSKLFFFESRKKSSRRENQEHKISDLKKKKAE